MLIELMILSVVYLYAFGIVKIKPSTAPGFQESSQPRPAESFGGFYCGVWAVTDVLGTHALSQEAATPLAKSNEV